MIWELNYATPSVFESRRDQALIGLAAERPVRFHCRVRPQAVPLLRFALRTMGEVLWSFRGGDLFEGVLDPLVTVHPDRVFLEAFSADQTVYARLMLEPDLFEVEGEVRPGTTQVDFTSWFWAALGEMRTSRETWLRVDPEGFEVATSGWGGRFQPRVEVPRAYLLGLLELQSAMMLPGTRLSLRPVDLLSAVRFLRHQKARTSPRGLRYEFDPGQPARIVLEPWEHAIELVGCEHGYTELRRVRTWGRARLSLLEPLLPFADRVEVFLKGRSLPTFYLLGMGGVRLLLGLSGWSGRNWQEPGFSLTFPSFAAVPAQRAQLALEELQAARCLSEAELALATGWPPGDAARALEVLVRRGRALYEVETRRFRHRELSGRGLDEALFAGLDPRQEEAERLAHQVQVERCEPQETRRLRRLETPDGPVHREVIYRDWRLEGKVEGQSVEVVLNDLDRVIFGTCTCPFFQEHLLQRGPCSHMLALRRAAEGQRDELPSSVEAPLGEPDEED